MPKLKKPYKKEVMLRIFDPELVNKLEELAEEAHRPLANMVIAILHDVIDDYYKERTK